MKTKPTPEEKQPLNHIRIRPLLFVTEMQRSISFYCEKLGFSVDEKAESGGRVFWCRLSRQGCSIMLQQEEAEDLPLDHRGRGVVFYFVCDDADAIHRECTDRGLSLQQPATAPYGMRQVHVPEPDGYNLCFESEI